MKARVTNKSLYNVYDLFGENQTSRTNRNVSKLQTSSNYPAINDEILSRDSLNSANQNLQLDHNFGCLPTLSKMKKIWKKQKLIKELSRHRRQAQKAR